jgi:tol-pal system protein YbgF
MKSTVFLLLALTPLAAFGQKKEIVELQRDVALLQDQLRTLQRTQDDKLGQLTAMIQQAVDASTKANTAIAMLQGSLTDRIGEQAKSLVGPVAGVGTKIDQMADEFRSVRESVADLSSRMGKLDAKLSDINTAISTLRNPPAAPPPSVGMPGGTGAPPAGGAVTPPAGVSAEATYQNAYRDMQGGQMDLALQEFSDYLKYFGNTDYAPNAQFYIGDLYLRKGDTESAIKAFDAVLERYSENNKTPDARYMKGRALVQAGKPTAAAQEFREIIKRYPDKDVAAKAKAQLKALGYSTSSTPSSTPKRRKR